MGDFPQLPEALRLIEAWGFRYKSVAFVWLKRIKRQTVGFMVLASGRGEMRKSACWLPRAIPNGRRQISISLSFPRLKPTAKAGRGQGKDRGPYGRPAPGGALCQTVPARLGGWGNEVKSTIPDFGTKCPEVKGAGKEADPCPM